MNRLIRIFSLRLPARRRPWQGRVLGVLYASALMITGVPPIFGRSLAVTGEPMQNVGAPSGTTVPGAPWHTIRVVPPAGQRKIHTLDKLNPVWWLENSDDAVPPAWYLPTDRHRALKWRFRNPFHNFDHYVIGVADKEFTRSGRYPERNSDPRGGWDIEIARRKLVVLPFLAYERSWCDFYCGWREHGAFGIKLVFHRNPKKFKSSIRHATIGMHCNRHLIVT